MSTNACVCCGHLKAGGIQLAGYGMALYQSHPLLDYEIAF